MADEETPKGEPKDEPKTFTEDDVKALLEKETSGLKSKVDELLGEAKSAKQKARDAAEQAAKEAEERAKASGDVEALEKSWLEKYQARDTELSSALSEKDKIIASLTAGSTAKSIATELAVKGSESILERFISDRLGVEIVEGQPKVIVKDAAGQRSAATVDDLKKELLSTEALKPILAGTKASGAGGVNANGGAGGGTKPVKEWTSAEKSLFIRENGLDAWKEKIRA